MTQGLKRYYGHGDLHYITCSCLHRRPLLGSPEARDFFLSVFEQVRRSYVFDVIAYVVMPEHVHLLISESPAVPPAKVIQVFKQRVSRRKRGKKRPRNGQLALRFPGDLADYRRFWQRRYYDFNVYSRKKLWEKLHYMHANPVAERLVRHPREWPWSSWAAYATGEGILKIDPI